MVIQPYSDIYIYIYIYNPLPLLFGIIVVETLMECSRMVQHMRAIKYSLMGV